LFQGKKFLISLLNGVYIPSFFKILLVITSLFKVSTISVTPNGITLQLTKLKTNMKSGDKTKIREFDLAGTTSSLTTNFRPSAIGCSKPQKPTTLGPRLLCIEAITFLSANVKYATATNIQIILSSVIITVHT
jgi:hypothetical protein